MTCQKQWGNSLTCLSLTYLLLLLQKLSEMHHKDKIEDLNFGTWQKNYVCQVCASTDWYFAGKKCVRVCVCDVVVPSTECPSGRRDTDRREVLSNEAMQSKLLEFV